MTQASTELGPRGTPSIAGDARVSSPTVEAIYAVGHWLLARERAADAAKVFRVMLRAAPRDERGWLGLGQCHERIDQPRVAAELYGAGSVIAGGPRSVSVRCLVARARVLAGLGREDDVEASLVLAERAASDSADDELVSLVARERTRQS
jgi:hypothetical protein